MSAAPRSAKRGGVGGQGAGMSLLPRDVLDQIGRLQIGARGMMEGYVTGRHRSPYKGFSAEFAEHRQYVAGDDIRRLDWRVWGRNDRHYVREYVDETNLRATLLLDCSGSMKYAGDLASKRDGKRLSKLDYARYLAAAITYLLINQQDAVSLVTFDTAVRKYIPARSTPTHLQAVLDELAGATPGQETDLASVFHNIAERVPRRGLVMILSDLFADLDPLVNALHHFRYRKHEIVLFHVMAEEERTFPFSKWSQFRSLELADQRVRVEPAAVRAAYLERVRVFRQRLDAACGQMQIDLVPLNTAEPFERALARYLTERRVRTR